MISGPSGCGKKLLVREAAAMCNAIIYRVNCALSTAATLSHIFQCASEQTGINPCVLSIENAEALDQHSLARLVQEIDGKQWYKAQGCLVNGLFEPFRFTG